ncbi:helix-turn-helix domain-containing protein [Acetobacter orientalis]
MFCLYAQNGERVSDIARRSRVSRATVYRSLADTQPSLCN